MDEAIREINRLGLGATLATDPENKLAGIITDGDIRRTIARKAPIYDLAVADVMTANPRTAHPDAPAYDALNIMEKYQITVLPIVEADGTVAGILHLHDILGKGEFKFNGEAPARSGG
jgi:arabinose-5-phosphate isomerase